MIDCYLFFQGNSDLWFLVVMILISPFLVSCLYMLKHLWFFKNSVCLNQGNNNIYFLMYSIFYLLAFIFSILYGQGFFMILQSFLGGKATYVLCYLVVILINIENSKPYCWMYCIISLCLDCWHYDNFQSVCCVKHIWYNI